MDTKKKKSKVWIWIVGVIVLLLVIALVLIRNFISTASETVYASYTLATGSLETTITGSGKLESSDSQTLQLPGGVTVSDVLVEAGDAVKAGETLALLDPASLANRAAEVSGELSSLDRQIASRSTTGSVTAPVRGRIKYLPVAEGDAVLSAVSQYGALAILSSDELMQVSLTTDAELALYAKVKVVWAEGEKTGRVAAKTATGYIVTLSDNGTPYLETAQVFDGDTLLGEGALEIHSPVAVLAAGGVIDDIRCEENDLVYANNVLFTLSQEPETASYRQALTDRAEKAALYQTLLAYQTNPQLTAPSDGVVSDVLISDHTDAATAQESSGLSDALTLHLGGAVKMSIDVDELDINSVSLGQAVAVTMDAFPNETFEATVTHISRIGSAAGSITTYPVEVTLANDARLFEGMNGSAVITTAKVENVLLVPIDATYEDAAGTYVYTRAADGTLTRVNITTGLSDGTSAEVTSGLSAGDIVWYADTSASANSLLLQRMANNRAKYETQDVTIAPTNGGE
ncbi:MAG: HlyD family efflux transporter periplasmic adaptor subunit [Clostridiaceae bacterium]